MSILWRKFGLWSLFAVFLISNFLLFFATPSAVKAIDYPAESIQPITIGPLAGNDKTIAVKWRMDVNKAMMAIDPELKSMPYEVKFLISIDNQALVKTDHKDGQKAAVAMNLYTDPTSLSQRSYDGFFGEVQYKIPDNNAGFAVFGSKNDQEQIEFTLIDNKTIPNTDKGTAKEHTYKIRPIILIARNQVAMPQEISMEFKPGSASIGEEHDINWYWDHYFSGPTRFFVGTGGTNAAADGVNSRIYIPGHDFGGGKVRPGITFKLKYIISYSGAAVRNTNELVFVSTNPEASNLAILVNDGYFGNILPSDRACDKNVAYPLAAISSIDTSGSKPSIKYDTFGDLGSGVLLYFAGKSDDDKPSEKPAGNVYYNILDSLYKGGPFGPGKCPDSGDLTNAAKSILGTDADNTRQTQATPDDTCGVSDKGIVNGAIAKVLCALLKSIGDLGQWLVNTLFGSTFDAQIDKSPVIGLKAEKLLGIGTAHAQIGPSAIKNALNGTDPEAGWVLTSWRVVLGLADVFVAIIIIGLAVINILHIQYDTYAIKKVLPQLIIGVILANFSILITKMLVDATNVLTVTFAPEGAGTMVKDIITAVIPENGQPDFITQSTPSIWTLILALLFSIAAVIAFLVLGFIFYIRYVVILAATIAAPLAFVLMAFPPTQGFFKQWWGWYAKFIFMKPISFFLVWLAWMVVENSGGNGITSWIIATFLIYAAVIVPFKMGGAVTAAWGRVGKKGLGYAGWATGTGKDGYLRKPVDNFVQGKKDAWKMRANNWVNQNTALGRWRASHQMEMDTLKGEGEAIAKRRQAEMRQRKGSHQALREAEVANSNSILEEEKVRQQLAVESGNFNHISRRQMKKITGQTDQMNIAQKYIEQANSLKQMQEGLEKRRTLDLQNLSMRDLREEAYMENQLKELFKQGKEIHADFSETGERMAPGTVTKLNYVRAVQVSEELRLKAKSETNEAKRKELLEAAKHFQTKADEYRIANEEVEIKDPATGAVVRKEKINYNAYLGRNLSGRRMKVLNPAVNDEAETAVLSDSHEDLIKNTTKTFGTSEYRANETQFDQAVAGDWHKIDDTAAFACMVQLRAIKKVMDRSRHGDAEGLETMQLFMDRIKTVRPDFKSNISAGSLSKLAPNIRESMEKTMMAQAGLPPTTTWSSLSPTDQKSVMDNFDFQKLDLTSTGSSPEGKAASANRAFISRFLSQMELDEKLGFSKSPGGVLRGAPEPTP